MTKKIRLTDEAKDEADVQVTLESTEAPAGSNDIVVRQLMKYLEAIDWKLWEILKIQKKLVDKEEDNNA
mgnify:CR=1 FL=1|jgi:hypothetical protein